MSSKRLSLAVLVISLAALACTLTDPPSGAAAAIPSPAATSTPATVATQSHDATGSGAPAECTVSAHALNVRACGSLNCPPFYWLSQGERLEVIGAAGDWLEVLTPSGSGWIHSLYCERKGTQ